jgi:hypothetical protein
MTYSRAVELFIEVWAEERKKKGNMAPFYNFFGEDFLAPLFTQKKYH